jgi:3-phenylpropionate/trans-cinnamate dioxygenase ferredoxin subunit
MKYVVAEVDEIQPGKRKIVDVARRSIGIFNIDGSFFALRNHCPHQGGPLCLGKIWGSVTSNAPGEFVYRPGSEIITCPHHGWDFNIRTGQSWCDPERLRTSTYQVDIENGDDIVRNETMAIPDENGRVKGPYVVETIPVRVEGRYLVVELK